MGATPYIMPLVGLFFLVFGLSFFFRSRKGKATAITKHTHRKLGLIYTGIGLLLLIIGLVWRAA